MLTCNLQITTLAGYPLGNVPLSELDKGHYLAIATSIHPHPAGPHKVNLVGRKSMPRETRVSYINANKRYKAPAKVLDKMRESRVLGDHQLDKEGTKKLKEGRAMAVTTASRS